MQHGFTTHCMICKSNAIQHAYSVYQQLHHCCHGRRCEAQVEQLTKQHESQMITHQVCLVLLLVPICVASFALRLCQQKWKDVCTLQLQPCFVLAALHLLLDRS